MGMESDITDGVELADKALIKESILDKARRFKEQQAQLALFHADLDVLKERYQVDMPILTRVAIRFSELRWWGKGFIILSFIAASVLIGLASIAAGILLGVVTLGIYGVSAYLFNDYAKKDGERFDRFCSDVLLKEEEMKESVLSLQKTEESLFSLLEKLESLNAQYANEALRCANEMSQLEAQVKGLNDINAELARLKGQYREAIEKMTALEQQFAERLNESASHIEQDSDTISRGAIAIDALAPKLKSNLSLLTTLAKELEEEKDKLVVSVKLFTEEAQKTGLVSKAEERADNEAFAEGDAAIAASRKLIEETNLFYQEQDDFLAQRQKHLLGRKQKQEVAPVSEEHAQLGA